MTIQQAIKRADALKPNAFTNREKTEWLNALEGRIAANIFLMAHVEIVMLLFDWPSGKNIEMLVKPPHDDIYIHWLCAKIDEANGEYNKYQNSMQIYNEYYGDFLRWFAGLYDPVQGYMAV
ncbi:MAG: hypothetical protein FWG36_02025 [Oscillospiraceae bacterium]|nr:hypothetical protein [Oscillospiraceae bacterium]